MTKREWLAKQGLAIAGARGKFSRDANEALKNEEARCKAEDVPLPWTEAVKPEPKRKKRVKGVAAFEKSQGGGETSDVPARKVAAEIVSAPKQREETVAWVVENGVRFAIQFCGKCQRSISRCTHDVPYAPDFLGGGLASFVKPEV
jgi:hypothetical protein